MDSHWSGVVQAHVGLTDPFGECDLMEVGKIAQLRDEDGVNALYED